MHKQILALSGLFIAASIANGGDKDAEVSKILTKVIQAYGGKELLVKANYSATTYELIPYEAGKKREDFAINIVSYMYNEYRHIDTYDKNGFVIRTISTDKACWRTDGSKLVPSSKDEVAEGLFSTRVAFLSKPINLYDNKDISVTLGESVTIRDRKCLCLKVKCAVLNDSIDLYFDSSDYSLLRCVAKNPSGVTCTFDYDSYIEYEGHLFSSRILFYRDNQLFVESKLKKIKFLEKDIPKIFDNK